MNNERDIFQPYLTQQFTSAGAVTYGEKLKVIAALRQDVAEGKIPIQPDQVVRLKRENPAVQAVREGRAVSLDGADSAENSHPNRWQGILGLVLLLSLPLCGFGGWWLMQMDSSNEAVLAAVPTRESAKPTDMPTATPSPQLTATPPPTITPFPTVTPLQPTIPSIAQRTESDIEIVIADDSPVVLEVGGRVYPVQQAKGGDHWQPSSEEVEWWPETHVQRLFAMPHDDVLLQSLFGGAYPNLSVRLRSGEQIQYALSDVQQVNRLQTEVLSTREPGITIVLYTRDTNPDRWVIRGQAIQGSQDYLLQARTSSMPETEREITWIEGDRYTVDDYQVTIQTCSFSVVRPSSLTAENVAAIASQQKIHCWVEINSAEITNDLQIADANWLDALDWLPVTQLISQTVITETNTTLVQLAGIVRQSDEARPLLLWSYGQTQYGFQLNVVPNHESAEP